MARIDHFFSCHPPSPAFDQKQRALFSGLGWPCSHVRAVVATLGGQQGAARRADKWQHLYAGFTVWLSHTEATGNCL